MAAERPQACAARSARPQSSRLPVRDVAGPSVLPSASSQDVPEDQSDQERQGEPAQERQEDEQPSGHGPSVFALTSQVKVYSLRDMTEDDSREETIITTIRL